MQRIEHRVTGVSAAGKPVLDDGRVLDVANVIWATGFRPDFSWIDAPITGDDGWPREYRGVVDEVPGLFFCGLSFQFAFSSMVLPGVGRDAAYVAGRIDQRAAARTAGRQAASRRPGRADRRRRDGSRQPDRSTAPPTTLERHGEVADMGVVEDLHRAREAYERREWVAAYRALSDLDDDGAEGRRTSPRWRPPPTCSADATTASTRFSGPTRRALAAGDRQAAVRAAYLMTVTLRQAGELAVGNGWHARAARLLDEIADDVAERGYLCDSEMMGHILDGEFAEAFPLAPRITDYGRRFDEPDLLALGLHAEGRLMLYSGRVADGLKRMDEALVGVMAGEVTPVTAGRVYCSTIEACQEVSDFGRAGEWTHALTTWCDAQPGLVAYTGQCATHRGQLLRLHGAYADAVEEFERAVDRYRGGRGRPGPRAGPLRARRDTPAARRVRRRRCRLRQGRRARPPRPAGPCPALAGPGST